MSIVDIDAVKRFIKDTARPLEKALYSFYFENGSSETVISELEAYQNPDGGFGKALEADNWNPASNPIATNDAIITLYRTGTLRSAGKMVRAIVSYLSSHDSFDEERRRWLFAIDSNKDYPHAIWWEKKDDGIMGFNPTVSLAAFMVCYGPDRDYYTSIVREGFAALSELKELGDTLKCYLLAFELLKSNYITDVIDLQGAKVELGLKIREMICKDTSKYGVEYVITPSDIFCGTYDEFVSDDIKILMDAEKDVLGSIQKEDGGFDISWKWYTDYKEFEEARNMWRPRITLDKLLFIDRWD